MMETAARQRFIEEYRQIRSAEGRGSDDPSYYRELPYRDLTGRNSEMWQMRAKTYRYFERQLLGPIEHAARRPLAMVDVGAGNCWMSHRLTLRGHRVCAVDIFVDNRDGLLTSRHYLHRFPAIAAEFDYLPFREACFDLAIFNSSLHYSTSYEQTLTEVRRILRPDGRVIILDSPIYRKRQHGERMVAERHADFQQRYGFCSDALRSIEFLDEPSLVRLADSLRLRWTIYRPWYGWRWHSRPFKAWVRRQRPPSRFWILVGQFEKR